MVKKKVVTPKSNLFLKGLNTSKLSVFKAASVSLGYKYNEFFEQIIDTYLVGTDAASSGKKNIPASGRKARQNKAPISGHRDSRA